MKLRKILKSGVLLSLIASSYSASYAAPHSCVNWPSADFQPIANKQTGTIAPDYGLYWFKLGSAEYPEDAKKAYTPQTLEPYFANGKQNKNPGPNQAAAYQQAKKTYQQRLLSEHYFDPNKPTVIFIHGWNPNSTINKKRFDFCYQYNINAVDYSPQYNTLEYFKKKGWNVAVFYWNQFSDEQTVPLAESKIYSGLDSPPREWTYLDKNHALQYCANSLNNHCMALPDNKVEHADSVSSLAFHAYVDGLPENYHQTIHIVGFSLGTQVAIQLARAIVRHPALAQPSRLTLLDPFFSANTPAGLDNSVAEYSYLTLKNMLKTLAQQHRRLAISMYRTSPLSIIAYKKLILGNPDVSQHIAYTKLSPKYFDLQVSTADKLGEEHISAPYLYFESMKAPPVDYCWSKNHCASRSYIDAASTDQQIYTLEGQKRFQQPNAFLPKNDSSEHDFSDTQDDVFSKNS